MNMKKCVKINCEFPFDFVSFTIKNPESKYGQLTSLSTTLHLPKWLNLLSDPLDQQITDAE